MPGAGLVWRHIILGTRYSWMPGDTRGWRSRGHRRHSSGDYKNPPPITEHAGLRRISERQRNPPLVIPRHLREIVGQSLVTELKKRDFRVLVIAVSSQHAHLLSEMPIAPVEVRRILGEIKAKSSRAIRNECPGRIWAGGGKYEIIDTPDWQHNVYHYIRDKQGTAAWRWTFKEGNLGFIQR